MIYFKIYYLGDFINISFFKILLIILCNYRQLIIRFKDLMITNMILIDLRWNN